MSQITHRKLIAYYRVSTRSRAAPSAPPSPHSRRLRGWRSLREYTEVETGKGADALDRRPQLAAALKAARKVGASICVGKLDRLSRNVAFISD
jgi:DNA invertase Pin-like site-specific DNA recombinase